MAVYGNAEGTGTPMVFGLTDDHIDVQYKASPVTGVFSYPGGEVTVSVTGFNFKFVVPIIGTTISMPDYHTTLTAESAGQVPPDVGPTPAPTATPTPARLRANARTDAHTRAHAGADGDPDPRADAYAGPHADADRDADAEPDAARVHQG